MSESHFSMSTQTLKNNKEQRVHQNNKKLRKNRLTPNKNLHNQKKKKHQSKNHKKWKESKSINNQQNNNLKSKPQSLQADKENKLVNLFLD